MVHPEKCRKFPQNCQKISGAKKWHKKRCRWRWTRMNEGDRSSHAHLYSISRGFAETWGVRAETYEGYVQITCGVPTWYAHFKDEVMGRGNLEDVFIEERSKCSWYIIEKYSKIQKQSVLLELLFQNLQNFNFFPIHCSGIFGGKIYINNTSAKIKCGNI